MALEGEEARLTSPAWSHVSAEAKQLVSAMLERRVDRRLTADEVLRHPWLASAVQAERARAEAPPSAGPRALLAPGALAAAVAGLGAPCASDRTTAETEVEGVRRHGHGGMHATREAMEAEVEAAEVAEVEVAAAAAVEAAEAAAAAAEEEAAEAERVAAAAAHADYVAAQIAAAAARATAAAEVEAAARVAEEEAAAAAAAEEEAAAAAAEEEAAAERVAAAAARAIETAEVEAAARAAEEEEAAAAAAAEEEAVAAAEEEAEAERVAAAAAHADYVAAQIAAAAARATVAAEVEAAARVAEGEEAAAATEETDTSHQLEEGGQPSERLGGRPAAPRDAIPRPTVPRPEPAPAPMAVGERAFGEARSLSGKPGRPLTADGARRGHQLVDSSPPHVNMDAVMLDIGLDDVERIHVEIEELLGGQGGEIDEGEYQRLLRRASDEWSDAELSSIMMLDLDVHAPYPKFTESFSSMRAPSPRVVVVMVVVQ